MSQAHLMMAQGAAVRGRLNAITAQSRRGVVRTSVPYWSRFFFVAARSGVSPAFLYTVVVGTEVRAFGYQKGQDLIPVGLPGVQATSADTNLIKASNTLNGQTVHIYGIGIQFNPNSDFELARLLAPELSVSVSLNGDDGQFFIGTPILIPGAGGLFGAGNTQARMPEFQETVTGTSGTGTFLGANGNPQAPNYKMLPERLIWRPEGNPDSNLLIKLKAERTVVLGPFATRVAAAGVGAVEPPATIRLDGIVQLMTVAESDLSVNSLGAGG